MKKPRLMLKKRATAIEFSEGLGNPTLTAGGEPPPLRFCFAFCTFFLHEPKPILSFTLYVIIVYLTGGILTSVVADLNIGEPRTVRMVYFLPNDRPYRADVVQRMKDDIRTTQTFYAEQMGGHGYEEVTFRVETDAQGEPMVHRVDGEHPDVHYLDNTIDSVSNELSGRFNLDANIYLIVIDNSADLVASTGGCMAGGFGWRHSKSAGGVLIPDEFEWDLVAHELGHAFGLLHNFRNDAFVMSYGQVRNQLSACSSEFLVVHPYFNPDTPIQEGALPTIELISPRTYPAGSNSVSVQLKVSDSEGLQQVLLFGPNQFGSQSLMACRGLSGEKDALVDFNYDGVFTEVGFRSLSSDTAPQISIETVDSAGNTNRTYFILAEVAPGHIATVAKHTNVVRSVVFSPDGAILASGALDETVLWDAETQTNIAVLQGGLSTSFSPDGTTLASGTWGQVNLLDVTTGANIATLPHTASVNSVSFSPDGKTLASGAGDGTVKLWDIATERNITTLDGHTAWVSSVSFSLDGNTLASGAWDKTVKLWDVATRQNIATFLHTGGVHSVSFSPDETTLASGADWGEVRLWNVSTGANIATFGGFWELEGGTRVISVSFSPDGTTLASGMLGGTVKLWDVATGAHITTLGHTASVNSVSFSPDGRTLASGLSDGTVELWDTTEWTQLRLEAVNEVNIPDPKLRAAIATALGKPSSASIVRGNMTTLVILQPIEASINDLTGIESAIKLSWLDLWDNNITDISALAGLTNLTKLRLDDNNITDISAVSGLTNLAELNLWDNNITDISALERLTNLTELRLNANSVSDTSALAGLTNLTTLWLGINSITDISAVADLTHLTNLSLGGNNIRDISPVSGLTNLTWLGLAGNSITDISAVANLTNLTEMYFQDNNVSDLSPLVANVGLGSGAQVSVQGNPLSYQSIHTHIPILQSRGVEVRFDNQAHPALLKISGDNQNGASFASLSQPFVVEAQDENGFTLAGISVTFAVTRGGGTLSNTTTRTDENGRAQSTLILGPNLGTNTVSVSATDIESSVTFYAIADMEAPPITADVNGDGSVNILDLILIASEVGNVGANLETDVNGDGVVNILDLVLAAGMFDEVAAAPSTQPQIPETLTAVEVEGWLTDSRALEVKDVIVKRGFVVLEQLLLFLTPRETELLANYPNPFNPETWIPYRLAEDAFVTLTIYDNSGQAIRTLEVGHQVAAAYENRSKAVYWDGRNDLGEQVASGVYFYHLSAGEHSATRRMVILK